MNDPKQQRILSECAVSDRIPLTPASARPLVLACFAEKDQWSRQDLAKTVEARYLQSGGLRGKQQPVTVVKKVLSTLHKEGLVQPVSKGLWRWCARTSPQKSAFLQDRSSSASDAALRLSPSSISIGPQPTKLTGRPTYGNPIDFRGLRHEPVNEDGVIFLFGMVARELGFLVEAVQAGFPDCEAKRRIGDGHWQQVRIEFEFQSRNFRVHRHAPDGCDVIVYWRHNWKECPPQLEVVELSSVLKSLSSQGHKQNG